MVSQPGGAHAAGRAWGAGRGDTDLCSVDCREPFQLSQREELPCFSQRNSPPPPSLQSQKLSITAESQRKPSSPGVLTSLPCS